MQVSITFVLETKYKRLSICHRSLNHVTIKTLRTHRVRTGIWQNRHSITRLHPTIFKCVRNKHPKLMTRINDNISGLLPTTETSIHNTRRRTDETFTGRRTNTIPRRGGFLQKLQGNTTHDTHKVRTSSRLIKLGGNTQCIDHIRRSIGTRISQVLWKTLQDPLGLNGAQRSGKGTISKTVQGILKHGCHDIRLHDRFQHVTIQCKVMIALISQNIPHPIRIRPFDTRTDRTIEMTCRF
mmetsp:Transcript_23324/g.36499  ORF Transcript_23324/g.36499 Transcript_23324/m.36499 type:complete len:239 (-) Transcript_23324:410-1126(-)